MPPSPDIAIDVQEVSKTYLVYSKPVDRLKQMVLRSHTFYKPYEALRPTSFQLHRGESLGILGRNGSGKSTLLQLICGTLHPTSGDVITHGRISALLELGSGFNPQFTGKENIYMNGAILGLSREEIDEKYDAICAFADIGDYIHQPVKTYSSGMTVRLAFAVAVVVEPDILVVDEALAVGDAIFQRKCFAHIEQLQEKGTTILFVSHAAGTIIELCDRALLLDNGTPLFLGPPKEAVDHYHKLIFALPKDQPAIRKAICADWDKQSRIGNTASDDHEPTTPDEPVAFNPKLKPRSTVITAHHGVVINNLKVTDRKGEEVNQLISRERYQIHYQATFEQSHKDIRFNMLIKNITGQLIAGANTRAEDERFAIIEAGSHYHAMFEFKCDLLPGDYYITLGSSAMLATGRSPVARINDALMFRVLPSDRKHLFGTADLECEPTITETKKAKRA